MAKSDVEIQLKTGQGHEINFGTEVKPDYKGDGEIVSCSEKVAEGLVIANLATYVEKGDKK
jgi:hypothetical protein